MKTTVLERTHDALERLEHLALEISDLACEHPYGSKEQDALVHLWLQIVRDREQAMASIPALAYDDEEELEDA
jgi:hypothetical protein